MLRVTRRNSRRKKLNQSKRHSKHGGASLKEIWLSKIWQSREHQENGLQYYITQGNKEKVKIYANRILNWHGKQKFMVLFEALSFASNVKKRKEYSPDIIYFLMNLPHVLEYHGWRFGSNYYDSPVDFAINTGNLAMMDKLLDRESPINGYNSVLLSKHIKRICELGNLDMYRKISSSILVFLDDRQKQERFTIDKETALIRGHVKLANLIQSMKEGREEMAVAEPGLPAVPPVENLERIRAVSKPPAAPM
jgi:hypothetical protein